MGDLMVLWIVLWISCGYVFGGVLGVDCVNKLVGWCWVFEWLSTGFLVKISGFGGVFHVSTVPTTPTAV